MQLTYHDIMNADLSALTTAAGEWRKMAEGCETVRNNYRDHVRTKLKGWSGDASTSFWLSSNTTLHELSAAKTQAEKVASLLDDAHERLVEARKHLTSVRDAAIEEGGMKVDEYGKCTTDTSKLLTKDVDGAASNPVRMHAEAKWTRRIQKAVQHVDDTDYDNMLALKAAAKDTDGKGDKNGFNSRAVGDVEKYAAQRSADLAMRLNADKDGGGLTPKERHELQVHMRSNATDPEFSRPFLKGLGGDGAEGTIKLANALTVLQAKEHGEPDAAQYRSLEKSLATNVASATAVPRFEDKNGKKLALGSEAYGKKYAAWLNGKDGAFYQDWRKEMQRVGAKEWSTPSGLPPNPAYADPKARGYQTLATLMKHGDGYSAQMLHDLGDDIHAAEKKDKDIWDNSSNFPKGDLETDPYDAVLGLMAKEPETAASYLDPSSDSYTPEGANSAHNDRLEYLVKYRDWESINGSEPPVDPEDKKALDKDAYDGFEAALKAGATGRMPEEQAATIPPHHSAANARIMDKTVQLFGEHPSLIRKEGEKVGDFLHLRPALGDMAADYSGDIQRKMYPNPDLPVNGATAKLEDGLTSFLGSIARDPHSYGAITAAQQTYTAHHLQEVAKGITPDLTEAEIRARSADATQAGARVSGIMAEAKADSIYEEKIADARSSNEKVEEASKWANRFASLATGGAIGGPHGSALAIPPAGWAQEDLNKIIMDHIQKDVPEVTYDAENKAQLIFDDSRDLTMRTAWSLANEAGRAQDLDKDSLDALRQGAGIRAEDAYTSGTNAARAHGAAPAKS
ncbi:hypothetical protein GCM10009801_81610 [Streptomyces albiaxialis]|uniref:AG2 protein n=1 Tax=Streptomyces albiaxialis TaxID=329523 RepID=A0ABN2X6K2_9ACTN